MPRVAEFSKLKCLARVERKDAGKPPLLSPDSALSFKAEQFTLANV